MISLLHPSYKRPQKSFDTINNWFNKSYYKNYEVVISLDSSDVNLPEYLSLYTDDYLKSINGRIVYLHNRNAVQAINHAAKESKGHILIVVSDDTDCPQDWDYNLLRFVDDRKDWILKTKDGIQDWIITMPVMHRSYYNRFGYIYFPEYIHMFCDTELSCVADMTGSRLDIDMLFPHNHYSIGKSQKDEVSVQADKTWAQGEALFLKRFKENFGLTGELQPIKSKTYLNWIASKR